MAKRKDIIIKARSWVGINFKLRGRTRNGIDCIGLISAIGNELKLIDYDFTEYQINSHGLIKDHLNKAGLFEVKKDDMLIGDILNISIKNRPMHLSILSTTEKMIHTNQIENNVVECYLPNKRNRITRVFRYPNIED